MCGRGFGGFDNLFLRRPFASIGDVGGNGIVKDGDVLRYKPHMGT